MEIPAVILLLCITAVGAFIWGMIYGEYRSAANYLRPMRKPFRYIPFMYSTGEGGFKTVWTDMKTGENLTAEEYRTRKDEQ